MPHLEGILEEAAANDCTFDCAAGGSACCGVQAPLGGARGAAVSGKGGGRFCSDNSF